MKLESVSIAGFMHFSQPCILQTSDLPPGVIAVRGENGAGKSTLVEAAFAGLFGPGKAKAFPSREGTLHTYATSRDAYIEATWLLEGIGRFRSRVNVDGVRRKTDAVLQEFDASGVLHPINDGKVETYIDAVAERFPSQRAVLASAFAAQTKRGGFGELGQRDRMELFVELADLAHLEARSQTAKRCHEIADGIAARIQAAIDVLRRDAFTDEGRSSADIAAELKSIAQRLDLAKQAVEAIDAERPEKFQAAERYVAAASRLDELRRTVTRAEDAIRAQQISAAKTRSAHDLAPTTIARRYDEGVAAIKRRASDAEIAYRAAVEDRETRIANNQQILADTERIRAAVARKGVVAVELQRLNGVVEAAKQAFDGAIEQVRAREVKLAECTQAARALDATRQRVEMLKTVKFGEQCAVDPACPLVSDVVAARAQIPEIEGAVAQATTLTDGVTHWNGVAEQQRALKTKTSEQIGALQQEVRELDKVAALAPHLDHAQERIAEYRRDAETAAAQYASAGAGFVAERRQAEQQKAADLEAAAEALRKWEQETTAEAQALAQAREAARRDATAAEGEVSRLVGAKDALERLERALEAARSERWTAESELQRLETLHAQAVEREAARQKQAALVAEAGRRLRIVEDEALAWGQLATWCGRDGLQRLEIDAAGPVVSDLANQLLRVGYGPRFSIEIVTQVATADGKDVKEKFTILAIDNAHGGEARDISDLSGGEKVVVEEAVRAALACYVNLRSRHRFRTLFRDETTGALDPENAPRYVAMLRKLMEISGADQILFVTHSPVCAALADAQVRIANGQATIALPPYQGVA